MYKSIVAAVDKLSEKFFVLMTDEVGLQRGYTNYPALDYARLPPANQQRGRRFTHQSDCDSQATIEDQLQQKYLSKEDKRTSSKSLISLHKFYEPGLSEGVGKEGKAEGVCYEHTKTNGFDYVTLTPLKADERSRQHSVQTDNNHQEVGTDNSDNHWRAPGRYQQTSLFSLDNIKDNMPYAQGGRHGQTADDDTDTGAQATGFLVPYPHDRRQRNLSGQEVRFMSMRAMHECDFGLSWIEENKSEVRPTKKQLYAESGPIKEKVRIVYERDASVSCYSEQDYAGNNVFVILSDNISGDARFGDYVIGTVPTMQPEKFYSDRLDLNTREALLQAQQQYDDRLRADNKDIASWWNNQEASVIPTIIASRPRGKDERETMPDYTDSYSNTLDYCESEDQVSS